MAALGFLGDKMKGIFQAQFVASDTWSSRLIRYLTNSPISHVDIVMPDGQLLGALPDGVKIRPANYGNWTTVYREVLDVDDLDAILEFAKAQIGKPYNYRAIWDMVRHKERAFQMQQSSWFCDELVYASVMAGKIHLLNTDDPLYLTPFEVYLSSMWRSAATKVASVVQA